MKKYIVGAVVTVSVYTEVNAGSPAEAIEVAESRQMQGLCHFCSTGEPTTEWSLTGELDGQATDLQVESFDDAIAACEEEG